MNINKTLATVAFTVVTLASISAYAWSVKEDHGSTVLIGCSDGSNSTVAKNDDGTWTVSSAGKNGKTGGNFPMVGKAAQAGCGE